MGHECTDCQFVADRAFIHVTPQQADRATITLGKLLKVSYWFGTREDYIVELGRFTSPGWAGHAMWYLFACPDCLELSRDYLHGQRLFLICQECDARWQVRDKRFFREAKVPMPLTAWQKFKLIRRLYLSSRARRSVR